MFRFCSRSGRFHMILHRAREGQGVECLRVNRVGEDGNRGGIFFKKHNLRSGELLFVNLSVRKGWWWWWDSSWMGAKRCPIASWFPHSPSNLLSLICGQRQLTAVLPWNLCCAVGPLVVSVALSVSFYQEWLQVESSLGLEDLFSSRVTRMSRKSLLCLTW